MEAIAMPMRWEDFGEFDVIFRGLRSGKGKQMILEENFFVETILPRGQKNHFS
jgi:haloalkane dehalogenase